MRKKQFKAESKRLLDLMIHSIYTNKEIFLREIISNASDAMDKLAYIALTDQQVGLDRENLTITITRDEAGRTLTVSDNGVGMNEAELAENLGTICKSGSLSFKENMEETEDIDIIGQFGVGFYSAFMVCSNLTVISRKYGEETAWKWTSDGASGYTIEPAERPMPGTDIIMTLKEDSEEAEYAQYLQEDTIRELVKKYSDYIRYPIRMEVTKTRKNETTNEYETYTEVETLNSMVPLWHRAKADVTEEEYNAFYREKFFDYNKPLRVIHFSVEGTVSFKALLYIPAKVPFDFNTREFEKGLQLYSSGVMIMENCSDLLPEHFRFVRGVVDSQDLSLNISREMLQHDRQLSVIAKNIARKIKSELTSLLKNDREAFEGFYGAFSRQLKYAVAADYGVNKDATQDLLLFPSAKEGKLVTLKEYVEAMAEGQEKIYFIAGENPDRLRKLPQVQTLTKKGYDVLLFTDEVDEFLPQSLMTYLEKPFCNAATEDLGLQTEEEKKELDAKAEELKGILTFVQETLGDAVKEVRLSSDLGDHPVSMVPDMGLSFEMEKYMKRVNPEMAVSVGRILVLNPEHPAVKAMIAAVTTDIVKARDYARLLCCQAQLLADLPLEDPVEYTQLVCRLMQ